MKNKKLVKKSKQSEVIDESSGDSAVLQYLLLSNFKILKLILPGKITSQVSDVMLSITEMMFLTLQEKAHYVWNNGRYCKSRREDCYRINLYWMGSFYAEVWYNRQTNQIQDVVLKAANAS